MKAGVLTQVPVDAIVVGDRLRPVDDAWAAMLAENIAQVGVLRQPIEVRQVKDRLVLIAGGHRLEAVRRLGWETIPALVYTGLTEIEARLAEVDENLVRHELSPLDRATFLAQRKELYEQLHPETRGGVAGGKARHGAANEIISFAADTAKRVGLTERSIQLAVTIARGLDPAVRAAIAGTVWAKKQADLILLAKAAPEDQRAALEILREGLEPTVKAALDRASGRRPAEVDPMAAALTKLLDLYGRSPALVRRQFLAHLREVGDLDADVTEEAA